MSHLVESAGDGRHGCHADRGPFSGPVVANSSVYAKNSIANGGWMQEVGPGNAIAVATGGGTQLFLRGDHTVFARNSISGGTWVQETDPGTATAIAVSSTGVQMIIACDASIWAKNGIGYGGWTQEVGSGNAAAIAVGGDTQMFIRGDSAVFAKTGIGNGRRSACWAAMTRGSSWSRGTARERRPVLVELTTPLPRHRPVRPLLRGCVPLYRVHHAFCGRSNFRRKI